MRHEAYDVRLVKAWAENLMHEVEAIKSLDELSAWIVANNQKLGQLEHNAQSTWNQTRAMLHAKDGQLRAKIRQGVG